MAIDIKMRTIESARATEVYISAVPKTKTSLQNQAEQIFFGIRDILSSVDAYIFQEWIFVTEGVLESISEMRLQVYGDIDDGVAPSLLVCREGLLGPFAGVQVHAIKCENKPEVIEFEKDFCGRIVKVASRGYLALSGISAPDFTNPEQQARAMFEKAERILQKYGAGFVNVPRTWMWLGDILSWYGQFNQVRNNFFVERGIISNDRK